MDFFQPEEKKIFKEVVHVSGNNDFLVFIKNNIRENLV